MNEAQVAGGSLVVSGCQAAKALELVEATLYPVPQCVCEAIYKDWLFPVDLAGYDRRAATPDDHGANAIAVVAAVGDENPGVRQIVIDQCVEAFEIRDFAAAYLRADRQSVSVGNEVDLGREATF